MMHKYGALISLLLACLAGPRLAPGDDRGAPADENLRQARAFVARSDRYMDYSRLRRGMSGYGLTVLTGTRIQKFGATVVSVLHNWYPHQAVVLCRLSGLGLEKTGIVSGMSGSPVFIEDPADGKHKLIGALAYGWQFQKEPICGIQPISQMLAIEGVPLPGRKPAGPKATGGAPRPALDEDFVRAVLNPRKSDFADLCVPRRPAAGRREGAGRRMVCLSTPVMISGVGPRTLRLSERVFDGTGLVPIQGGAVGEAVAADAGDTRLQPGSSLAISLVTGDADWAAVGTVTEVIGQYVLGLGHSFHGRGAVEMPMGSAYVHTVISSAWTSFKIGSTLKLTGALTSDEYTGVGGRVGQEVRTIPMTVSIRWDGAEQRFSYRLVRHNWMTAVLAGLMMQDSLWANRDLPERHTVEYAVDIEFERFGRYRAANVSSGRYASDVGSDLTRPLAAMMNAVLGEPVFPKRVDVSMSIRRVERTAEILALDLERHAYKPGETVRGKVTIRPFRAPRTALDVALTLPEDLRDGQYALSVRDGEGAVGALQSRMPHRFTPRTVEQLFQAVQRVVERRTDHLYLQMDLPDGGVAVEKNELEHLPASLAEILARTAPMDTKPYRRMRTVAFPADCVVRGSASASFTVQKQPRRTH